MLKNVRKIYNTFQKFRKNLDQALYRDKGIKIDFYYELDEQFRKEDLKVLNQSLENMYEQLEVLKMEIEK